ncbi:hypothetical protein UFOVP1336_16 [uncultured Caudovirales phage]|uniref:DUF7417 domain-containing protein n=1 Tax=uncultured Caudovirales phage TaxID=2100421 RepID=A0A6J5RY77_9CAUD|nr:hypothetical protein UFOVP1336_16 [uncultured Caudovirales phage]
MNTQTEKQIDIIGSIIKMEQGELSFHDSLRLFAILIKTGEVWKLQGSYGRAAKSMIDDNLISTTGEINWERANQLIESAEANA